VLETSQFPRPEGSKLCVLAWLLHGREEMCVDRVLGLLVAPSWGSPMERYGNGACQG